MRHRYRIWMLCCIMASAATNAQELFAQEWPISKEWPIFDVTSDKTAVYGSEGFTLSVEHDWDDDLYKLYEWAYWHEGSWKKLERKRKLTFKNQKDFLGDEFEPYHDITILIRIIHYYSPDRSLYDALRPVGLSITFRGPIDITASYSDHKDTATQGNLIYFDVAQGANKEVTLTAEGGYRTQDYNWFYSEDGRTWKRLVSGNSRSISVNPDIFSLGKEFHKNILICVVPGATGTNQLSSTVKSVYTQDVEKAPKVRLTVYAKGADVTVTSSTPRCKSDLVELYVSADIKQDSEYSTIALTTIDNAALANATLDNKNKYHTFKVAQGSKIKVNVTSWFETKKGRSALGSPADQILSIPRFPDVHFASTQVTQPQCPVDKGTLTFRVNDGGASGLKYILNRNNQHYRQGDVHQGNNYTIGELASGNYHIQLIDGCGNKLAHKDFSIQAVPPIRLESLTKTDLKQHMTPQGSLTLSISGGVAPYTYRYSLDGNGESSQTTQTQKTFSDLRAGHYSVTVTDACGGTASDTLTLNEPPPITVEVTQSTIPCYGAKGSVILDAAGGNPGVGEKYGYRLLDATKKQLQQTSSAQRIETKPLPAGNYYVEVTDQLNIKKTFPVLIRQWESFSMASRTSPSGCDALSDGELLLLPRGGDGNYQVRVWNSTTYLDTSFAWSSSSDSIRLSGLVAQTYRYRIFDGQGCVSEESSLKVEEKAPLQITGVSNDSITCFGEEGNLRVTCVGGSGHFNYALLQGEKTILSVKNKTRWQETLLAKAGTYQVQVSDGCRVRTQQVSLYQPDTPRVQIAKSEPLAYGYADGRLDATLFGSTPPYRDVVWKTASGNLIKQQTEGSFPNGSKFSLTNVPTGSYILEVKDQRQCRVTDTFFLDQPDSLQMRLEIREKFLCPTDTQATVVPMVMGGVKPYSYLWEHKGKEVGSDSIGILQDTGTIVFTLRDANGITLHDAFTLAKPEPVQWNFQLKHPTCNGSPNGSIQWKPQGGTGSFQWFRKYSNRSLTPLEQPQIDNLHAGEYSIGIIDERACRYDTTIHLVNPSQLEARTIEKKNPICPLSQDGLIAVEALGGTAPYTFRWGGGVGSSRREGIGSGNYQVVLTDAQGCSYMHSEHLNDPAPIPLFVADTFLFCRGMKSLRVDAHNGLTNMSYHWSGENAFQKDTPVAYLPQSGDYKLTVRDRELGCVREKTIHLKQIPDEVNNDFLFKTYVATGETINLIEVNRPASDKTTWYFPQGTVIEDSSEWMIQLYFQQEGDYEIVAHAVTGQCSDWIVHRIHVMEEGVSEALTFNIYPNPMEQVLNIESDQTINGEVHLTLFNLQGQAVRQQQRTFHGKAKTLMDVSGLPVGAYILFIKQETGFQQVFKVIKR